MLLDIIKKSESILLAEVVTEGNITINTIYISGYNVLASIILISSLDDQYML